MQRSRVYTNVSKQNSLYISREESSENSYQVLFVNADLEGSWLYSGPGSKLTLYSPPLYVLLRKKMASKDQLLIKSQQPDIIKVKINSGLWM